MGGYIAFCYDNTSTDKELEEDCKLKTKHLEILLPERNINKYEVKVKPETMKIVILGYTDNAMSYNTSTSFGIRTLVLDMNQIKLDCRNS